MWRFIPVEAAVEKLHKSHLEEDCLPYGLVTGSKAESEMVLSCDSLSLAIFPDKCFLNEDPAP